MPGPISSLRESLRVRTRVEDAQRAIKDRFLAVRDRKAIAQSHERVESAWLDPRIGYPCYKSFDDLVDVERLKSLDGFLKDRLAPRREDGKFWAGPWVADPMGDRHPGSRVVDLKRNTSPNPDYFDQDKPELWVASEHAEAFAPVMDFVATLPFEGVGRVMIMYDFSGKPVTAHRDHDQTDVCHEFIWFRTAPVKPLYMMNKHTGERRYVDGHSAWFDTVNQFHGVDALDGPSISFRVDGKFNAALRALIPVPRDNAASAAALWACAGDALRAPEPEPELDRRTLSAASGAL